MEFYPILPRILVLLGIIFLFFGSTVLWSLETSTVEIQKVKFQINDVEISALLIIPKKNQNGGAVIAYHGFSSRKEMLMPLLISLGSSGYVVLAPDLRGHGDSGGTSTLGLEERLDVFSTVDFLLSVSGVNSSRIGLIGRSYGAMISILGGASDNRIKTVVSVSSPGNLTQWTKERDFRAHQRLSYTTRIGFPDEENITALELRSPLEWINSISSIFLIHGTNDALIPKHHVLDLYNATSDTATKKLWLVKGASHDVPYDKMIPDTISWLNQELLGINQIPKEMLSPWPLYYGWGSTFAGLFLLWTGIITITGNKIEPEIHIRKRSTKSLSIKYLAGLFAIYSILHLLISLFAFFLPISQANEIGFLIAYSVTPIILYFLLMRQGYSLTEKKSPREIFKLLGVPLMGYTLIVVIFWLLYFIVANFTFLFFSGLSQLFLTPFTFVLIVVATGSDEVWFRVLAQEHLHDSLGNEAKEIFGSTIFYTLNKGIVILSILLFTKLIEFRWFVYTLGTFLLIGFVAAFIRRKTGFGASTIFVINVYTLVYASVSTIFYIS